MLPNEFEATNDLVVEVEKEDVFKETRIKEYKDDYFIKKCLKFAALGVVLVFGGFLTILFIYEAINNLGFRGEVLSTVKYNLGAIFVAIFSFLGIKIALKSQQ